MVKQTCRLLVLFCSFILIGLTSAEARIVSGQELADAAAGIIRQYTGSNADITATSISILRDVTVPDGNVDIVASLPNGVKYNLPTLVYVNVVVDGQIVSRNMLRFEVKMYQEVVVAARNINVREILGAEDLRYERLDVGRLSPGYLTNIDKAVGLQVGSFLRPGAVVSNFSLQKPVLIKRGSTVNIIARVGGLEVSTVGMAMQDGVLGQIIRVQNVNSRRIMSVKVLDEANVLIPSFNGK